MSWSPFLAKVAVPFCLSLLHLSSSPTGKQAMLPQPTCHGQALPLEPPVLHWHSLEEDLCAGSERHRHQKHLRAERKRHLAPAQVRLQHQGWERCIGHSCMANTLSVAHDQLCIAWLMQDSMETSVFHGRTQHCSMCTCRSCS